MKKLIIILLYFMSLSQLTVAQNNPDCPFIELVGKEEVGELGLARELDKLTTYVNSASDSAKLSPGCKVEVLIAKCPYSNDAWVLFLHEAVPTIGIPKTYGMYVTLSFLQNADLFSLAEEGVRIVIELDSKR